MVVENCLFTHVEELAKHYLEKKISVKIISSGSSSNILYIVVFRFIDYIFLKDGLYKKVNKNKFY